MVEHRPTVALPGAPPVQLLRQAISQPLSEPSVLPLEVFSSWVDTQVAGKYEKHSSEPFPPYGVFLPGIIPRKGAAKLCVLSQDV